MAGRILCRGRNVPRGTTRSDSLSKRHAADSRQSANAAAVDGCTTGTRSTGAPTQVILSGEAVDRYERHRPSTALACWRDSVVNVRGNSEASLLRCLERGPFESRPLLRAGRSPYRQRRVFGPGPRARVDAPRPSLAAE